MKDHHLDNVSTGMPLAVAHTHFIRSALVPTGSSTHSHLLEQPFLKTLVHQIDHIAWGSSVNVIRETNNSIRQNIPALIYHIEMEVLCFFLAMSK